MKTIFKHNSDVISPVNYMKGVDKSVVVQEQVARVEYAESSNYW